MSKLFTPGPWSKDYGGTKGHIKSIAPHPKNWTPTVCRYDTGVYLEGAKKFEYTIQDESEREANANLISKSPELYECLKDLAMLNLQSDFYKNPDVRDVVDRGLSIIKEIEK